MHNLSLNLKDCQCSLEPYPNGSLSSHSRRNYQLVHGFIWRCFFINFCCCSIDNGKVSMQMQVKSLFSDNNHNKHQPYSAEYHTWVWFTIPTLLHCYSTVLPVQTIPNQSSSLYFVVFLSLAVHLVSHLLHLHQRFLNTKSNLSLRNAHRRDDRSHASACKHPLSDTFVNNSSSTNTPTRVSRRSGRTIERFCQRLIFQSFTAEQTCLLLILW